MDSRHRARRRDPALLAALLLANLLGLVSLAWACGPAASLKISPDSGPPGTQITLSGRDFPAGPVTISFGSNATSLAQALGPTFSVAAEIPDVSPGVYYVIGTATANGYTWKTVAAFKVLAPAAIPSPTPSTSADAGAYAAEPASAASTEPTLAESQGPQTVASDPTLQAKPAGRTAQPPAAVAPDPAPPIEVAPDAALAAAAQPEGHVAFGAVLADTLPQVPARDLSLGTRRTEGGAPGQREAAPGAGHLLGSYTPAALVAATAVVGSVPIVRWRRRRRRR
ncbi:MAG: hypothetical protein ACRDJ4_08260 [Actinomycetota bacterium]